VSPEAEGSKPALARAYRDSCAENGRSPLSTQRFNERLTNLLEVVEITVHGDRRWRGVRTRRAL